MKKLILLSFLIVGCARDYECDPGIIDPDTGEFHSMFGSENKPTTTIDWPGGQKKAVEECVEHYPTQICTCRKI